MKREANKLLVTVGYEKYVLMEKPCAFTDSVATYLNTFKKPDYYYENLRLIPYGLSNWVYAESLVQVEEVAKDTTWIKVKILESSAPIMVGCDCFVPASAWLHK